MIFLQGVAFTRLQTGGKAGNSFGGIFFSTDGGSEWESLGDDVLIGLTFASPTAGWACALNGVILKYDGPGLVTSTPGSVKEEQAPVKFEAIHPSPFTENTNIQFSIAQRSAVQLEIVNTAGQVVARPINEELAPGKHQIRWSAAGLPGGVYICRLRAGRYTDSKKMVIVK